MRGIPGEFVAGGGSVVISSHVMALVGQMCDRVAVVNDVRVIAEETVSEVPAGGTLESAFVALVGARHRVGGVLSWLSR